MSNMDFIFKNFSLVCKVLLALAAVFIFIRIIPLVVITGVAVFAFFKVKKYFKNRKIDKFRHKNVNNIRKKEDIPFDISREKIVDVDYDEIKK
ncbi:conserved hypothetical protein [Clostridiaceae bacterium BL-3]|nr:conserved hypothetical protein [Clostridiaceae bacterium BL-3]